MIRQPYDATKENWHFLFAGGGARQSGTGKIAHFTGARPQYGYGVGGVLRTLFRLIPSFLSSPVGKSVVSAGTNIVKDVSQGASLQDSLKSNARTAVRNLTGVGRRGVTRRSNASTQQLGTLRRAQQQQQRQAGRGRRVIGFIRGGPPSASSSSTSSRVTTNRRRAPALRAPPTGVIRRAFIH